MKSQGSLGKLIIQFYSRLAYLAILLKLNKDFIARGVVRSNCLTVLTLFI
jgi:hypothetical protein